MADQEIVDYLRDNKAKFGLDVLKKGLLKQGVSYAEIKEAIELIEQEESEKISKFLTDKEDGFDIDEPVKKEGFSGIIDRDFKKDLGGYKEKVGKAIDNISDAIGVKESDKKVYINIVKYGAISFLFVNIISTVFKYIAGMIVFPKVASSLGVFAYSAIPEVFVLEVKLFDLLTSLVWSAVLGGIITLLFIKYIARVWPFALINKLQKKIFAFYLAFEVIFGVLLNGILSGISWLYLLGYAVVLVGNVIAVFAASEYLSRNLERLHEEKIKKMVN